MPPHRNMGWRKPVPKFIPEPPTPLSRFSSTSFKRLSFSHLEKDVPPLPDDWVLKLGGSLSRDKRRGFIFDGPIDPRWVDEYRSHPISFPTTIIHEHPEQDLRALFEDAVLREEDDPPASPPRVVRHKHSLPRVCQQLAAHPSPPVDLPDQLYRPPTPPLKRDHPQRRPRSGCRSPQQGEHDLPPLVSPSTEDISRLSPPAHPAAHIVPSYGRAKPMRNRARSRATIASRASSLRSRSVSISSSAMHAKRQGQGLVTMWADVKTVGFRVRVRMHHLFR